MVHRDFKLIEGGPFCQRAPAWCERRNLRSEQVWCPIFPLAAWRPEHNRRSALSPVNLERYCLRVVDAILHDPIRRLLTPQNSPVTARDYRCFHHACLMPCIDRQGNLSCDQLVICSTRMDGRGKQRRVRSEKDHRESDNQERGVSKTYHNLLPRLILLLHLEQNLNLLLRPRTIWGLRCVERGLLLKVSTGQEEGTKRTHPDDWTLPFVLVSGVDILLRLGLKEPRTTVGRVWKWCASSRECFGLPVEDLGRHDVELSCQMWRAVVC